MRTRIHAVLAALPLAAILALTGCGSDDSGSDDSGSGVASANGERQDDSDESNEPLSEDEIHKMQLEFVECLREHGLDVDDPAPGEGIQVQVEGDPAEADEAMKACEEFEPPAPSAEDQEEGGEEMLKYAECMRENGVEDFEDPKPGEGIHLDKETAEDPDFEEADETCHELFGPDGERQESER